VRAALGVAALGAILLTTAAPLRTAAATSSAFAVGVPTVVDPIRAAGEPDIAVDNNSNALITGPGGTGTQTSWFWRTKDQGQTYRLLGPPGGHYICAGSGGGDSLGVMDRATNEIYVIDQEALASLGLSKLNANTNALTAPECANAPAVGADRPFQAVIPTGNSTTPQSVADGKKPIVYLSWACQACVGGVQGSGLAFGWSDDGVTWHAADPGVTQDNLITNDLQEGGTLSAFEWHGSMVADPTTGDVFTAISCNPGNGCPNGNGKNEIGVAVGVPQAAPITSSNVGQFASVSYQTACVAQVGCNQEGSLFPVVGMDANHTLYEMWSEGNGFASPATIASGDNESWHVYYSYSLDSASDNHKHTHWSAPIRVDTGVQAATFGWMAVGDAGKLGFVFLGSDRREHPSATDATRQWHAYMAETTDATDAQPVFQQVQVGTGPNHIGDICLQGTVGCIQNVGNRNMADFISADIGPGGALQATWANDSNQFATRPTTLIPGLPITETAVQVSGPKLIGSGNVSDARFSTVPTTQGITNPGGNALYPVDGGTTNYPQLDIRSSQVSFDGANVVVQMTVADAKSLVSPDSTNQTHVWWLTTWQYNHKIYFAKAESDSGGAVSCTAGLPATYDRPGLNAQTVATLADYSGGTAESKCALAGNTFTITVPAGDVGGPAANAVLESTAAYSVLDNGLPPVVAPGPGNVPTVVDATPAYDALLATPVVSTPEAPLSVVLLVAGAGVVTLVSVRRRRRQSSLAAATSLELM
jgi:hypothetical protein